MRIKILQDIDLIHGKKILHLKHGMRLEVPDDACFLIHNQRCRLNNKHLYKLFLSSFVKKINNSIALLRLDSIPSSEIIDTIKSHESEENDTKELVDSKEVLAGEVIEELPEQEVIEPPKEKSKPAKAEKPKRAKKGAK